MKENPITGKMEVNWEDGEVDFREMYLEAKEAEDLATADDTDFGRLKGTVLNSEGKIDINYVQFAYSEFDIVNAAYGQKDPDRLQNLYKDTSIAVYLNCASSEILSTHTTSHLLDDISLILPMTTTQSLV